jgi:hypothetical protein
MELSERHNKFHVDDYGILILVNMKMSYFCGEYCGQLYQEKHHFDLYKVKTKMAIQEIHINTRKTEKKKIIQAQN